MAFEELFYEHPDLSGTFYRGPAAVESTIGLWQNSNSYIVQAGPFTLTNNALLPAGKYVLAGTWNYASPSYSQQFNLFAVNIETGAETFIKNFASTGWNFVCLHDDKFWVSYHGFQEDVIYAYDALPATTPSLSFGTNSIATSVFGRTILTSYGVNDNDSRTSTTQYGIPLTIGTSYGANQTALVNINSSGFSTIYGPFTNTGTAGGVYLGNPRTHGPHAQNIFITKYLVDGSSTQHYVVALISASGSGEIAFSPYQPFGGGLPLVQFEYYRPISDTSCIAVTDFSSTGDNDIYKLTYDETTSLSTSLIARGARFAYYPPNNTFPAAGTSSGKYVQNSDGYLYNPTSESGTFTTLVPNLPSYDMQEAGLLPDVPDTYTMLTSFTREWRQGKFSDNKQLGYTELTKAGQKWHHFYKI